MGQAKLSFLATAVVLGLTGCGGGSSSSVDRENAAPIARAGAAQTVTTGEQVTLSGASSSDVDGDALSYAWAFSSVPSGSAAELSDASAESVTFTPDVEGEYVVELVVNDGTVSSAASTVVVTATDTNTIPVADAGDDQNVFTTSPVNLNGSESSDADGDTLTYSWSISSQPSGSDVALSSTTSSRPSFTPVVDGEYIFSLTVNDGTAESSADEVVITAATENSAPVADAGNDRDVPVGSEVTLSGERSGDSDGDDMTFSWTLVSSPNGSTAQLSASDTINPTFTPDEEGDYEISLIVNDGTVDSAEDSVTISAVSDNSAPVADAGSDQSVAEGDTVQLQNNSTDADGDLLTSRWSFVSRPEGSAAALSDPNADEPTFIADVVGSYVVSLVVNDGIVDSVADNVSIDAIGEQILFFRKSGSTDSYFPFSLTSTVNLNISREITTDPLPASVAVQTYRLQAVGSDYTVTDLSAVDQKGVVQPFFAGLEEGVISAGQEVTFSLNSPLTNGEITSLKFTFTIEETGQTFTANYSFVTTTP